MQYTSFFQGILIQPFISKYLLFNARKTTRDIFNISFGLFMRVWCGVSKSYCCYTQFLSIILPSSKWAWTKCRTLYYIVHISSKSQILGRSQAFKCIWSNMASYICWISLAYYNIDVNMNVMEGLSILLCKCGDIACENTFH